jgi:hypothetical protein
MHDIKKTGRYWKQIALSGEFALVEAMDLSQGRLCGGGDSDDNDDN